MPTKQLEIEVEPIQLPEIDELVPTQQPAIDEVVLAASEILHTPAAIKFNGMVVY